MDVSIMDVLKRQVTETDAAKASLANFLLRRGAWGRVFRASILQTGYEALQCETLLLLLCFIFDMVSLVVR